MRNERKNAHRYAHIVGWGKYIPEKIVTNHDLSKIVDTSHEWIVTRTGIVERRVAGPKETTSSMALEAAKRALQVADIEPRDVDLIIVASATPDHLFPATACLVQDALGATRAGAFDLSAGCSGFVYALSVASPMITAGAYDCVLVIGSETLSRILDWTDRNTCVLFGDGAGAFVLQGSDTPGGVLSFVLGSDGSGGELLIVPAGGSRYPASLETIKNGMHYARMNGREVFRFATRVMGKSALEAIRSAQLPPEEIDLFIPHQANLRIIKAAAKDLKLPMERVFVNLDKYGNTSAASVPIAFCEAIEQDRLHPGDHVVLMGFGAGLTWAASVVEWRPRLPAPRPARRRRAVRRLRYYWARWTSLLRRWWRRLDTLWGSLTGRRLE
ncbi:MAG: ketoacyl-ACP synthase III [Chloroflexi bacterium]|nr:ketoacyl-ACP synthase III [Chloroflexota bacterium]